MDRTLFKKCRHDAAGRAAAALAVRYCAVHGHLQLRTLSPTTSQQFRVTTATFGAALPRVSWPSASYSRVTGQLLVNEASATPDQSRRLVQAQMTADCSRVKPVSDEMVTLPKLAALLIPRSVTCSVEQQALAAQQAEASLVIIRDSIAGAFAAELSHSAYYDCTLGEETVTTNSSMFPELADPFSAWTCSSKPACVTSTCVLTGKTAAMSTDRFQACCFTSNWLQMQPRRADDEPVGLEMDIPVLLVSFQDGNRIDDTASIIGDTAVLVWAFNTEETPQERQLSYEKVARILAGELDRSPSSSSISTTVEPTTAANEYESIDDDRLELSIRLPNLRVATSLLTAAFIYDVFFVYVSPLVFGSNVMVDVASGGGSTRLSGDTDGDGVTVRPTPMVLSVPLVFSVYGGEALLGLGDIIIPGLLVALCIRYDYYCGQPLSRGYFCAASCAYAFGLMVANIMAIVLRDVVAGQPALMYVVPTMLMSVLGLARINGELEILWDGSTCFGAPSCHTLVEEAALKHSDKENSNPSR
ncbi:Peptidase A22B, signal peptide peptidase [Phytophthora cactorum]|nr:Peptidase A22B, signal peptide peptidase [Phytophthora cactorum]